MSHGLTMTAAHIRLAVLALVGLAVGALTALAVLPQARERLFPSPAVKTSGRALIGGPFALTDHNGRRVTDADFRGRIMLVVFGATSSPDAVPSVLQVLSAALDRLGPQATRFAPVLVTVDPESDTPDRLKAYVARFHPRLVGLTGTPAEVAQVLAAYRIRGTHAVAEPDRAAAPSPIYVMDADGSFRTVLSFAAGPDAIAASLAKMLSDPPGLTP
jgi:cytochrome oxidase Cu insertion factor (SCO1/SenC/PrrC family)